MLKKHMRPVAGFFLFLFDYRPCVGHATVCATPDCVHRVTVLCCAVLCHIARAVPLCPTVLYSSPAVLCCAVLSVYCAVLV
jgi:hypothetical protein